MSREQQTQELMDEEPTRSWQPLAVQQQQHLAGSCGSLTGVGLSTPIRHTKSSGRQLASNQQQQQQEFSSSSTSGLSSIGVAAGGGGGDWTPMNDAASTGSSSSGWRHLTSSPSRRAAHLQAEGHQTTHQSGRRPSPHCWSSESLLKDSHSSTGGRWSDHPHHPVDSDREPFIPPPPLLDFETANLLPPLGIDVSSPSDDLRFLSVPSGQAHSDQEPDRNGGGSGAAVNWVQIPPQYATLRRPARSGSGPDGYSTSTALRRPRSSSNNSQAHGGTTPTPSWMDSHSDHDPSVSGGCHRTVGADGISRKCTCGQKMRLQQQQHHHHNSNHQQQLHQQQQNGAASLYAAGPSDSHQMMSGGHIRSDDGISGIATLRRPVKRKGRSQLLGVQQMTAASSSPPPPTPSPSQAGGGNQSVTAAAAAAAAILQQPKLETSVLLDKLLRAGALRPEDYLVLSRMERMIMANHAAGGNNLGQSSSGARIRQPKSNGQDRSQSQQSIMSPSDSVGSEMHRRGEFEFSGNKHLNPSGQQQQQQSSENLYDSSSSVQSSMVQQQQQHYPRRLSAGNNGLEVPLRMQSIQLPTTRPSPGPSPFDYYSSPVTYPSGSGGSASGRGSAQSVAVSDSSPGQQHSILQQQQQSQVVSQQQQQQQHGRLSAAANTSEGLYSSPSGGPYQPALPSLPSSRCCPCCGSPSHPQLSQQQHQQHHHHHHHHHHHTCSLCGGGPHLSAGTAAVNPSSSSSSSATAAVAASSNYSGYANGTKMMMQQPATGSMASSGYGYTMPTAGTGRHFSAGDQFQSTGQSIPIKYPSAIGSTSTVGNIGVGQQQPALVLGKVAQQPGVRTELHPLPSNEPIR